MLRIRLLVLLIACISLCRNGSNAAFSADAQQVEESSSKTEWERTYEDALKGLQSGRLTEGEKLLKESMRMEEPQGCDESKRARSAITLADFYKSRKRYPEAEALYRQVLGRFETAKNLKDMPAVLSKLAGLYKQEGKYEEALSRYKNCLAMVEKQSGQDSTDAAMVHANLALLFQNMGKGKDCEQEAVSAIKVFDSRLGPQSLESGQCKFDLGSWYMMEHRINKAIPMLESALKSFKAAKAESISFATCADELGAAYSASGRFAEAESLSRSALEIYRKLLGPEDPQVAITLSNLGSRLSKQGKNREALSCFAESLKIQEKVLGRSSPDLLPNLHGMAEIYVDQAEYKKTEALLRRDLELREKKWGENDVSLVPTLRNLSNCLRLEGEAGGQSEALMARADSIMSEIPSEKRKIVEALVSQDMIKGLDLSKSNSGGKDEKW